MLNCRQCYADMPESGSTLCWAKVPHQSKKKVIILMGFKNICCAHSYVSLTKNSFNNQQYIQPAKLTISHCWSTVTQKESKTKETFNLLRWICRTQSFIGWKLNRFQFCNSFHSFFASNDKIDTENLRHSNYYVFDEWKQSECYWLNKQMCSQSSGDWLAEKLCQG